MLSYLKKKIVGSFSERELKKYRPFLVKINAIESEYEKLSQAECIEKAEDLRSRAKNGTDLDDLLPEAFALVRKAAMATLGERHFDVQILGGIALHRGEIAEMKTGEGKTLTATLPLFLNALSGKGTHVVTVNDYLAERDSKWMGTIFEYLGMTVGVIKHGLTDEERRMAYSADITYGT
ncbi:MAG: preprotein translocase subunit SecA, partial [SAR324 cluster bacterium]|nr:preprotein translocase subunit SecA [SAR324 cluster bacterium]